MIIDNSVLRDWFAGLAMQGLIDGYDHEARMASADIKQRTGFDDYADPQHSDATYAESMAAEAYLIADAMLRVRERPPLKPAAEIPE